MKSADDTKLGSTVFTINCLTMDQAAKLDTSFRGEGGSGESYIGGKSKWNYRKLK